MCGVCVSGALLNIGKYLQFESWVIFIINSRYIVSAIVGIFSKCNGWCKPKGGPTANQSLSLMQLGNFQLFSLRWP